MFKKKKKKKTGLKKNMVFIVFLFIYFFYIDNVNNYLFFSLHRTLGLHWSYSYCGYRFKYLRKK